VTNQIDNVELDQTTDLECEENAYPVGISTAKAILLRAILWQKVHYWLTDNTPTATLDISSLPFIQSNVDNIFMAMDTTISSHSTNDELSKHQQRLRNNLAAWGFNIIPVQSDGDCFFHAVSSGLLQLAHSGNEQAQTVLSDLDTNYKNADMEKLLLNLRRSVVEEWTGPHSVEYQSFLSATHLFSEAESFRQRGVFSGELGDLVATAMANALQMPIVMFTSLTHFPVATVMPTYKEARTAHPICLAFTQFGAGHYDAVIPKSTCVSSTPEQQSHFSDKQLTESGCTRFSKKEEETGTFCKSVFQPSLVPCTAAPTTRFSAARILEAHLYCPFLLTIG
jgi:hypothetical protein